MIPTTILPASGCVMLFPALHRRAEKGAGRARRSQSACSPKRASTIFISAEPLVTSSAKSRSPMGSPPYSTTRSQAAPCGSIWRKRHGSRRLSALARLTKTLWTPLSARQALFAADTDENRRSLQRMSLRTFYLPQASTPQALNEISTTLRTLFEIRYSAVDPTVQSLTVRADSRTLDAVTRVRAGTEGPVA